MVEDLLRNLDPSVKAYYQHLYQLLEYALFASPKARITREHDRLVFSFTAKGGKRTYSIRVTVRPLPPARAVLVSVTPPFPMYLFAVVAPFAYLLVPAVLVKHDEEIKCLLVEDPERAVELFTATLEKHIDKVLNVFHIPVEDSSYAGFLQATPAGYVAFMLPRDKYAPVDVVLYHLEDGDASAKIPADYLAPIIGELWSLTSQEE